MNLLPQSTIDRLVLARFPVNRSMHGSRHGSHRSPFTGASAEFAQHREYSPGDEPRRIDWRVLARTDRFVVKQYDQETNLRATIILDASASMGYCGAEAHRGPVKLSKLGHAAQLAAGFAWMLVRQGDAVGAAIYDHTIRQRYPAASTPGHLHRILQGLAGLRPAGRSATASVVHQLAETTPSRGLFVLFSDLLEEPSELMHALHHLRYRHHELIVCQVLAPEEVNFPFDAATRFRDLEGNQDHCDVDPQAVRREYLRQVQAHLSEIRQACHQVEADYLLTTTDQPVDDVLIDFLAARHGRCAGRGGSR
ncbi:MAG TPA: DUF58 domain-containing protein [Pirellulaceae bacterium]|nr:DUF58 domain-containing protein [Pirellulaceae bacterium]